MIRINLLPVREIKAEIGRRQDLLVAGVSLGLTLTLVLAVYLFQFYRASILEKELAGLRNEIETLNVQTKEVAELEKKVGELKEKLKAIDELSKKKTGPVRVMESLSAAIPTRLWLTQFKELGGSLTISGLAVDNQTIADFMKALSQSTYFKNVDLVESTQIEQEGISVKKFSVKSDVSYASPQSAQPEKPGASLREKK